MGLPSISVRHFGMECVRGRSRLPVPAASRHAVVIRFPSSLSLSISRKFYLPSPAQWFTFFYGRRLALLYLDSPRAVPSVYLPLCLVSRLQRRTRDPENGSLATQRPNPQTLTSHGDPSIRLVARRSERNTHIRRRRSSLLPDHPQRKRGCIRQRFAERLALGCGGRKATACTQMRELPDSSAPERTMNSRFGLKRRLSCQRHGFEIGMPPRALCGKVEGQFNTEQRWRSAWRAQLA